MRRPVRAGPRVSRGRHRRRRPRWVLVTGTSAGRIVGRRTRARGAGGPGAAQRRRSVSPPRRGRRPPTPILLRGALHRVPSAGRHVYFEQIRVLKAGYNLAAAAPVVPSKGPEYWSHGIMEQDLGPAHPRPRGRAKPPFGAFPCAGRRTLGLRAAALRRVGFRDRR